MVYLQPSEYETYGLESTTPAALVAAASSLIDSHCRRPTLAVAQYVERLRLRERRNAVRLSYLPLTPVAPATSPLVAARGRYGLRRRGQSEAPNFFSEIMRVLPLPGTCITPHSAQFDSDS